MLKRCPRCEEEKATSEFYNNAKEYDGLQTYCKTCSKEKLKEWMDEDWLRISLIAARQKSRKLGREFGTFTPDDLRAHWISSRIDPDLCFYCKENPSEVIDHEIPYARGGKHTIKNCTPACRDCNDSKRTKPAAMFMMEVQSGYEKLWCPGCETVKHRDNFWNESRAKRGKQSRCIECKKEDAKLKRQSK